MSSVARFPSIPQNPRKTARSGSCAVFGYLSSPRERRLVHDAFLEDCANELHVRPVEAGNELQRHWPSSVFAFLEDDDATFFVELGIKGMGGAVQDETAFDFLRHEKEN